jgi:MscS family membrane protein
LETALAAYLEGKTFENGLRVATVVDELRGLLDASHLPTAARREVSGDTVAYVLDVLGRVGVPNLDTVPDLEAVVAGNLNYYTISGTPFRLIRIEDGPQTGEFLFSADTVQTAPRFFRGVETLPLRTALPIESWIDASRQLTGPMIPSALVRAIPEIMKRPMLGTPVWKIAFVLVLIFLSMLLVLSLHRFGGRRAPAVRGSRTWRKALIPLSIIGLAFAVSSFSAKQINVAGDFGWGVDVAASFVSYLGLAWALWLVTIALFETALVRRGSADQTLDANMLRLLARILGVIAVVLVLATGAQAMGLPVVSVLAGLGIGGLAVALAIRPTLENLIGGFILYLDKPIRVGDFCSFGSQSGSIESIGVRSTQIRALDRTLITVPNAQFADMQIINWAECDQMLIQETIGLRYDTNGDQLRYVLAKIREMFHAHPRIDSDTIRVRFSGYGPSSLDILLRVYAKTREWNDFFAVKEDVLFRVKEIVEQSGAGFALPSQTLYLGRDAGRDPELVEHAQKQVAEWRRAGRLPFPRFPAGILERLAGTLNYPPRGSPDFNASAEELAQAGDERLSAAPEAPENTQMQPAPAAAGPERS